jgi:hypothetical protein
MRTHSQRSIRSRSGVFGAMIGCGGEFRTHQAVPEQRMRRRRPEVSVAGDEHGGGAVQMRPVMAKQAMRDGESLGRPTGNGPGPTGSWQENWQTGSHEDQGRWTGAECDGRSCVEEPHKLGSSRPLIMSNRNGLTLHVNWKLVRNWVIEARVRAELGVHRRCGKQLFFGRFMDNLSIRTDTI